jgi:tripartite-type tricarboxylate transporter receptor subunit TctC
LASDRPNANISIFMNEKQILKNIVLAWVAAQISTAPGASIDNYPHRPIRLVISYSAGGPVDIVGRLAASKLAETFGQQVVADNRAGANGNIATEIVASSTPDGYTLLVGSNGSIAINPSLYRSLAADPVKDLAPVILLASSPLLLVTHPSVASNSVKDLIQLAKARTGSLNFASAGNGSSAHLAAELFKALAAVDMVHIPYKSAAPALTDLVAGQVQIMFTGVSATLPHVKAGKLKALGVTGEKRTAVLPEVPAIKESVPGYEVTTWYGLFAAAKTNPAIINRLYRSLADALASTDMHQRLASLGADAIGLPPEQFGPMIKEEIAKWAKVVKDAGVRPE